MNFRVFPLFTALAIKIFFCDKASEETVDTKKIHDRKLRAIGVHHDLYPCDPSAVVHNYSNVILSSRLRTLLAFGLEFGLPVYKLNYFRYFLKFEELYNNLTKKRLSLILTILI